MDQHSLIESAERLVSLADKSELLSWIETHLLKKYSPSHAIIATGKVLTKKKEVVPFFYTTDFPESVVRSFQLEGPCFCLPLWPEFLKTRTPVHLHLSQDHEVRDYIWWNVFKQRGVDLVVVACTLDHEGQFTYICMTDPFTTKGEDTAAAVSRELALIMPILDHTVAKIIAEERVTGENPLLMQLTARELEIVNWLKLGKTNGEIAEIIGVAFPTVKNHIQRIFIKLGVSNRTQAITKILHSEKQRSYTAPATVIAPERPIVASALTH